MAESISTKGGSKPAAQNRRSENNIDDVINPNSNRPETRGSIYSAVRRGNVTSVKTLLSRGLSVDATDSLDRTLLHIAVLNGDKKMVKVLKKYGAKVDSLDYESMTPVQSAAMKGHLKIFKLLVASSYEYENREINDITVIEKILPLHYAASQGHLHIVKYILKHGGKTLLEHNFNKLSPLHLAIIGGHLKCVRELLKYIDDINIEKYTSLLEVVLRACVESFPNKWRKKLIKTKIYYRKNRTRKKAERKYIKIIDTLFDAGMKFTENNINVLKLTIQCNLFLMAEKLLEYLIKFNENYLQELPALVCLAANGTVHFVNELLKAGADLSVKNCHGYLPIHYVIGSGNHKILSLLIRAGADINGRSDSGETIIDYFPYESKDAFFLYMILEYGFDIHVIGTNGQTGLHTLCYQCFNYSEYLGVLLDWFLDFNVVNEDGQTPLEYAMELHLPYKCIKFMIKAMVKMVTTNQTFNISETNVNIIISTWCQEFYENCIKELEELKLTNVWEKVTLLELLNKPLEILREYSSNDKIMEILDSRVYDFYPIYGDLIKSRMSFAVRLLNIYDGSLKTLSELISPIKLPDIITRQILSYLNVDELMKLSSM